MNDELNALRPYLNWTKVNDLARLPEGTLNKHFHHTDGGRFGVQFPDQHKPALRKAFRKLAAILLAAAESEG